MRRRRKSSKIVEGRPKKPLGESRRKSCARKRRKKRNYVELRKNRRPRGQRSAKNGSEIRLLSEKPRRERGRSASDRIRLNSNGFARNENAARKSKQS